MRQPFDMDPEQVKQHWLERSPGLARLFEEVRKVEPWTLDDEPRIRDRLLRFGDTLSKTPGAAQRLEYARRSDMLVFLVYIPASTAVYLLHQLDERHDGLGSRILTSLLEAARETPGLDALAQMLAQRLRLLNNTPFLRQVFDPIRVKGLERAIHQYKAGESYA